MRLWPWYVDEGTFSIILVLTAFWTTLSLSITRVWWISCERICRDLAFLGLHVMSALSVFGYILSHAEYSQDDQGLCIMTNCFQYIGEYLRRMFALWIYLLRLNVFIGIVYPKWVRYPAVIPMLCWVIVLSLVLNIEWSPDKDKGSFIEEGVCMDQRRTSSLYVYDTVVAGVSFQCLPSIIYLVLFIVPLLKYRENAFITIVRRHVFIAIADITIELLFFIAVVLVANQQMNMSYWNAGTILYLGLIFSNIVLIFIFKDWRDYFCIRTITVFEEDIKEKACSSLVQLPIQSNSLQEPLLDETL